MSLVLASTGLQQINDSGLSLLGAANGKMGLFTNNHTPVVGDVIGNFTEPVGGSTWYARQFLANWPASTYGAPLAFSQNTPIVWTDNGTTSAQIYGYFVVNAAGVLMWAELDPAGPFTLSASGYSYTVTPYFSVEQQ